MGESNDIATENEALLYRLVKQVTEWQASCKASDTEHDYR